MNQQTTNSGVQLFGGPFSPALAKLRSELKREISVCWLMVTLAALCLAPLGYLLLTLGPLAVPLGFSDFFTGAQAVPGSSVFDVLPMLFFMGGQLVGQLAALALPTLVVIWAVLLYRRNYTLAVRDLVWGGTALCLVDEAFVKVVEDAKRERYRLEPNPVQPGTSFVGRLNYFAYHYRQYYQLSRGPQDLRVPAVIQGNCWVEGSALGIGICPICSCLGAVVLIPLALRTVLVWPRIIAIKQATVDFLAGKFDGDLERLSRAAGPQPRDSRPDAGAE